MASRVPCLFLGAVALLATAAAAEGACPSGSEVGRLVSMIGEVRINGEPPTGELPFVPICAGDLITVGSQSRAGIYLLEADTPLRLDQDTVARIGAAETPDSGLFDLSRGAIYFLSQVRRTLTIRTPYVNAGIEGTEVYLRVREGSAELIVLEGRVALAPGAATEAPFAPATLAVGEQADVSATGAILRTTLPSPSGRFGALREVAVGALSWTLFYPDVLTEADAAQYPRIAQASRLLAAGQVADAEAALASVPATGTEAGLAEALRAIIAVGRKDAPAAAVLADRAVALAPTSSVPQLALSYSRQLAPDLDGAFAAAEEAARLGPGEQLPRARLAEIHLMRGETREARRAADKAVRLGGGPLAQMVLGFAELAALRGARGEAAFRGALNWESWNPLALLGLGLAQIKQGDLGAGTIQIENAVTHDPGSSLLRSYLGKAFFQGRRDELAAVQYSIAKELDPNDPTPWFYDAIRKQLDNSPIEALRDLEQSIELNDTRTPFRSRALLDQDLATRGAALSRIFRDLGFNQKGINLAARSLEIDPSSPAVHRFLSDIYVGIPRLEIARASELLQSQLLQDPNLQPLQPSLPFVDLDLVADAGPRTAGFNEFSPLFIGNGIRLDAAGTLGSHQTAAGEAAVAALVGRSVLSAGVFRYQSDGFRRNFDIEHDVKSVFLQTLVGDDFSVQGEYRSRDTHGGDRRLLFDADEFERSRRRDLDERVYRLGGRYKMSVDTDLVFSFIHSDETFETDFEPAPGFKQFNGEDTDTNQAEVQILARAGAIRTVTGIGYTKRDGNLSDRLLPDSPESPPSRSNSDASVIDTYSLLTFAPTPSLNLSLRLGWSEVDLSDDRFVEGRGLSGPTPGIAMTWSPSPRTIIRVAASRTVKGPYAASQTLRPTQLAGFNQIFDEFDGTRADQLDIAAEQAIADDLTIGLTATRRRLALEVSPDEGDSVDVTDVEDDRIAGFIYWTPIDRLAIAFEPMAERYRARETEVNGDPVRITTYTVPLTAAWFHPQGWYSYAAAAMVGQELDTFDEGESDRLDDWGLLLDLGFGYRLPARRGSIGLRVDNLLDRRLSFQDESLRTDADLNPRFLPSRTVLLTATVNF